jgi:hypothetical protein
LVLELRRALLRAAGVLECRGRGCASDAVCHRCHHTPTLATPPPPPPHTHTHQPQTQQNHTHTHTHRPA